MDENEKNEITEPETKENAPIEEKKEEKTTPSPEKDSVEEKINQEPFKGNNNNQKSNNTALIIIIVVIVLAIVLFGSFILASMFLGKKVSEAFNLNRLFNTIEKQSQDSDNNIDEAIDKFNNIVEKADSKFNNNNLNMYDGTQDGDDVKELIEEVVELLKKDTAHNILVVYKTTGSTDPADLTKLKDQFEEEKEYEVSMDYDSNGYINKITITDK